MTFNTRDFGEVPGHFGMDLLLPREVDSEDETMSETKTYPLRLPQSLKDAVERISKEDGTSINQFVAMAVAEKVSALETAAFSKTARLGPTSKLSIGL